MYYLRIYLQSLLSVEQITREVHEEYKSKDLKEQTADSSVRTIYVTKSVKC